MSPSPALTRTLTLARTLLPLLALAFACGGAEKTGDETRSGADDILPGLTWDDKVSSKADPVDWKRFRIDSPVPAVVVVHWDDPSIKARVALKDMFGAPAAEAKHVPDAPTDTLPEARLTEGTWFVEIEALSGASVYTLEVRLGGPSGLGVPRPE